MLTPKTDVCGVCWTTSCPHIDFSTVFRGTHSTPVPFTQLKEKSQYYIDHFERIGKHMENFDNSKCMKHDLCEFMTHLTSLDDVHEPNFCVPSLLKKYSA